MSISFACPGCGEQHAVRDERAGTKGRCRRCGRRYDVPYPSTAAPSPADVSKTPSVYGLTPDEPFPSQRIEPAEKQSDPTRRRRPRAGNARGNYSTPTDAAESSDEKSGSWMGFLLFHNWTGFVIFQCVCLLGLGLSWLFNDWSGTWYMVPVWLVATLSYWAWRRRSTSLSGLFSVGLGVLAWLIAGGCAGLLYPGAKEIDRTSLPFLPILIILVAGVALVVLILAGGGLYLGWQALVFSRKSQPKSKLGLTLAVAGLLLNALVWAAPLAGVAILELNKPVPDSIVRQWEEAGAGAGWLRDFGQEDDRGAYDFSGFSKGSLVRGPGTANDLPAFAFTSWKEGRLAKLPIPEAPFGLRIQTNMTDAGIAELAHLKTLQILILSRTNVTDAPLKELAALPDLQTLELDGTNVTGAGLGELRKLQRLFLAQTKVTDASLKSLARLKGLQILDLSATRVTDAGLKELSGLTNLERLFLAGTEVTGAGFKDLAALTSMHTLNLHGSKVSDAGLKELAGLKSLRNLDLSKTKVTDAGLKNLAAVKSLCRLDLCDTQITDAGLESLAAHKDLKLLLLSRSNVTHAGGMKLRKARPDCTVAGP